MGGRQRGESSQNVGKINFVMAVALACYNESRGNTSRLNSEEELSMKEHSQEDVASTSTAEVIRRFNAAFNRHDVEAVMETMTADCVFENTYPPPDGERYEGQNAVRGFWETFFSSSPGALFQFEDTFVCGDRGVVRWVYHWINSDGQAGHIRGVDVFRVHNGKVAEKCSYVKG